MAYPVRYVPWRYNTNAIRSGPIVAPVSSSAVLTAYPPPTVLTG